MSDTVLFDAVTSVLHGLEDEHRRRVALGVEGDGPGELHARGVRDDAAGEGLAAQVLAGDVGDGGAARGRVVRRREVGLRLVGDGVGDVQRSARLDEWRRSPSLPCLDATPMSPVTTDVPVLVMLCPASTAKEAAVPRPTGASAAVGGSTGQTDGQAQRPRSRPTVLRVRARANGVDVRVMGSSLRVPHVDGRRGESRVNPADESRRGHRTWPNDQRTCHIRLSRWSRQFSERRRPLTRPAGRAPAR